MTGGKGTPFTDEDYHRMMRESANERARQEGKSLTVLQANCFAYIQQHPDCLGVEVHQSVVGIPVRQNDTRRCIQTLVRRGLVKQSEKVGKEKRLRAVIQT